jgi:putative membrane protein (TIGR04086 family)
LFATVSLAIGCLAASFFASKSVGQKGYLIGAVIGAVSFIAVTLIALMANKGVFTLNTLFRLIILMLSSFIGGVLGVNRNQNKKYI